VALAAGVESVEPPAALKAKTIARAIGQPAHVLGASAPRSFTVPMAARAHRSALPTWLAAAAAVCLIAGLGAYAWILRVEVAALREGLADATSRLSSLRSEVAALRTDSTRLARTVSVLSAPSILRVDLRGQSGAPAALGRAWLGGTQAVFSSSGLPALAGGEIYQLWAIPTGSAGPLSAGVFEVGRSGDVAIAVDLPPGAEGARTFAVSLEKGPSGSSSGPKGPILLMGSAGPV
jgi:hypothetical protein